MENEKKLKSLTLSKKKLKGGTLWDFSTSILSQTPKKLKGDPLGKIFPEKKVSQCRKITERGTLWSRPVLYVTREAFLVQFLGPTGTIWRLRIVPISDLIWNFCTSSIRPVFLCSVMDKIDRIYSESNSYTSLHVH